MSVPGATAPSLGAARVCDCKALAPCVRKGPARLGLLSLGVKSVHGCSACGRSFAIRSSGHVVFTLLYGCLVAAAGALVVVHPPGAAVGAASSNRWFGVGLLAMAGGSRCAGA